MSLHKSSEIDEPNKSPSGVTLMRTVGLRKILSEDFERHRHELSMPGLHALFVYRIGVWANTLPRILRLPFDIFYAIGFRFCRGFYGIELQRSVKIGRRFMIAHQHGIVIHSFATFGDDCIVRQGVTFGVSNEWAEGVGPTIGNNVSFSPGCVIIGNVHIGNNVQIGPNCVITSDVPDNRTMFMPSPRALPRENGNS